MRLAPAAAVALPVLAAHAAPLAEPTCKDTEAVILGAGVAGLTAAQTLQDKGIRDFLVLEARNETGDRLYSHEFAGHTVELGANWVHGPGKENGNTNPMWTMVKKAGLNNVETQNDEHVVYPADKAEKINAALHSAGEATEKVFEDAIKLLTQNLEDRTYRAGQRLYGWDPIKTDPAQQLADWWYWDWGAASPPEMHSEVFGAISDIATYQYFSEEDQFVCDKSGFVQALRHNVSAILDRLLLNNQVTQIQHDANGVTVTSSDHGCVKAKYAIVTFSLGVLQKGHVKFDPPLPAWKAQGIAGFEMATYTKIFLKFPTSFWDQEKFILWADPHVRGNYPVFQPLNLKGLYEGSNILVATVTGECAYRVESQGPEATKKEIYEILTQMYYDRYVTYPEEIYYATWSQYDWSYGSYSFWPASTSLQEHQNLRANVDRVFFAGEATSQEFFGYLHGAYYEGKHVAEFLARCINTPGATWCDQTNYEVLTGVTPYDLYNPENGWYFTGNGVPGN
ncbi:hypothetical protein AbraIFM66951_001953 [Aspergillus brasiliensis]|uniref:Amine oxidase n=1 Tax=Aspergillus brasiliensis TaxID=319629 RepID=A0A9W6DJM3_9EURO|nr:hypothetical protein AbraCBS73388_002750 [Aspergillus brasiliensis]GKZ42559.1 hypothetical protein AbraIFM66951_001953 [Aspergillus brasiliensis]